MLILRYIEKGESFGSMLRTIQIKKSKYVNQKKQQELRSPPNDYGVVQTFGRIQQLYPTETSEGERAWIISLLQTF